MKRGWARPDNLLGQEICDRVVDRRPGSREGERRGACRVSGRGRDLARRRRREEQRCTGPAWRGCRGAVRDEGGGKVGGRRPPSLAQLDDDGGELGSRPRRGGPFSLAGSSWTGPPGKLAGERAASQLFPPWAGAERGVTRAARGWTLGSGGRDRAGRDARQQVPRPPCARRDERRADEEESFLVRRSLSRLALDCASTCA